MLDLHTGCSGGFSACISWLWNVRSLTHATVHKKRNKKSGSTTVYMLIQVNSYKLWLDDQPVWLQLFKRSSVRSPSFLSTSSPVMPVFCENQFNYNQCYNIERPQSVSGPSVGLEKWLQRKARSLSCDTADLFTCRSDGGPKPAHGRRSVEVKEIYRWHI